MSKISKVSAKVTVALSTHPSLEKTLPKVKGFISNTSKLGGPYAPAVDSPLQSQWVM